MTMKFNPYTGHERHPADIETDPEGVLIEDPDKPVYAARSSVDQAAQALVRKARVLDHVINPQRRGEVFVVRDNETGSLLAYAQPGNAAELLTQIARRTLNCENVGIAEDIAYESYKGFEAAFYEIADELGVSASVMSPSDVHRTKIMPAIRAMVGMQKEAKQSVHETDVGLRDPAVIHFLRELRHMLENVRRGEYANNRTHRRLVKYQDEGASILFEGIDDTEEQWAARMRGEPAPLTKAPSPPVYEPEPNVWYEAVRDAMKAIGKGELPAEGDDPVPSLTLLLDLTADMGSRPITPNEAVNAWNALMQIATEVDKSGPRNIMGNVKIAMEAQYQSGLKKGMEKSGMTPILQLIANERAKQIAKGYDLEHDQRYGPAELTLAAISYALPTYDLLEGVRSHHSIAPKDWPWQARAWHPEGEGRNTIKAIALLLARLEVIGIDSIEEVK